MRVAAGGIARKFLREKLGINIIGYLAQMGDIELAPEDLQSVDKNPFFCAEPGKIDELELAINALRKQGDSVGARVNIIATGMPTGLGEPVFGRLDADVAAAMMSINAVKGVEIGDGFAVVGQQGSEHRDEMTPAGFLSNHSGGTLGGISTGQDLRISIALKPTSSITIPGQSIDLAGNSVEVVTTGRHDPCVGLRAVPIAEAMLALVLMDHFLRNRGQNGDVISNTPVVPASV